MRRDFEDQRGVLERDRHGVVRDGLNRNLDALRDFGRDVVLRRDARRREDAAVAGRFERRQRDVEVERAVDRAERQADRARRAADAEVDRRRRLRAAGWPCVVPVLPLSDAVVRKRQVRGVAELRDLTGR